MHKFLPYIGILVAILVAALFVTPEGTATTVVLALALLGAVVVAVWLFVETPVKPAVEPVSQPSKPAPAQTRGSAEAEVITVLGMMQEKGRLIDFLMDDISAHEDAAVGAAARVVHQGCRSALNEILTVEPVETSAEGGQVKVPEGYSAELYRLTGNLSGSAPFEGTLVHKGWKVTGAKLPKVIASPGGEKLPPLAPAQVEVK